jgi:hypothetical protein
VDKSRLPPVEQSVMTCQMPNNHDRLCVPCHAIFMKDDEAGEDFHYSKRIHYSDGTAFIASARSGCCYFCAWTWRQVLQKTATGEDQPVDHTCSWVRQKIEKDSNSSDRFWLDILVFSTRDGSSIPSCVSSFTSWSTNHGRPTPRSSVSLFQPSL